MNLRTPKCVLINIAKLLTVFMAFLASSQAIAARECKIMVMGDSLSAAYGLPIEKGWVALMEAKLAQKFPRCAVINASVSGETTAGGKARLAALLKTHQPSLMILELGANDGLRGLPLNAMKGNLVSMVDLAQAEGAQTLLVGIQIPPNYGPSYSQRFAQVFEEVAKAKRLPLVPFMLEGFAEDPNAFQVDGIHPNSGSQPIILNNIWSKLEPVLASQ